MTTAARGTLLVSRRKLRSNGGHRGAVGTAGPQLHPPAMHKGADARASTLEVAPVLNGVQRSGCAATEGGSRTSEGVARGSPSVATRGRSTALQPVQSSCP